MIEMKPAVSALLDQFKKFRVRHFDISGQIPRQMYHRNYTLVTLQFIPLVPFDGQQVLTRSQRTNVPGDVIAPTDGLHPMNTTCKKIQNEICVGLQHHQKIIFPPISPKFFRNLSKISFLNLQKVSKDFLAFLILLCKIFFCIFNKIY